MESGTPILANSKNPKVGSPAAARAPVTMTFGGVPIMVIVPPTLAAIARGMSSLDAGILAAWQMPTITGIRQATVPVLEDREERTIVTSMIAAMSGISFVPAFLTTATPIASARPVLNIAAPMTNMPPKSTTVEFESPAYTCLDGSTPRMPSAVQAAIAVTASGISSVTNRNAATASTHSVIIAGSIKTTFLIVILVFKECLPLFAAKSIFQKSEKVHALIHLTH